MTPQERRQVVEQAAQAIEAWRRWYNLPPQDIVGTRSRPRPTMTPDDIITEAVGEPDSFDHHWFALARLATEQTGHDGRR